jgi:PTS system sucrose-specific IIC component
MDYKYCAKEICRLLGGKDNLISAEHCTTRLRLLVADEDLVDMHALKKFPDIVGVMLYDRQLQVIIGSGDVVKVFHELMVVSGLYGGPLNEADFALSESLRLLQRAVRTIGDVFVPIIPVIVASALLKGVFTLLLSLFPAIKSTDFYTVFHLFTNTALVFLPVLIGFSAAKIFGGNPYLGAMIGIIIIHNDLLRIWNVSLLDVISDTNVWFENTRTNNVPYQGNVIPVIAAVWLMCFLEKKLHKIVPQMLDLFVTPVVSVLITGFITITICGPLASSLENAILSLVQQIITLPYGIGSFALGAVYAPTVVAGIHHIYNLLEVSMLSANGINTWMPIATAANVAQGGAALAIALKTRNKKLRTVALPAAFSAFLGVTEAAIFGINLRYFRCFIAGCIGGACGALIAGITNTGATAYGVTGIFGYLITTDHFVSYTLVIVVAVLVAFLLSWLFYTDEQQMR